jgi:hypothetical protein
MNPVHMEGSIMTPAGRAPHALWLGACLWGLAAVASGEGVPRGPLALRDGQLLAQPRLVLPAEAATGPQAGRSALRVGLLWSNTFAWTQDAPGESPAQRAFLVDGESATLDVEWRRGVRPGLDLGLRLALHARGGGALDGLIDAFHRVFAFTGMDDGDRPAFRADAFRVVGRREDGQAFAWTRRGVGLGALELQARRRLGAGSPRSATALVARVALPGGTHAFRAGGVAAGVQLVATRPLGARAFAHVGLGASAGGAARLDGVGYTRARGALFAALERRVGGRVSLLLQSDVATRLVRGVERYPGRHWLAHAGAVIDLGPRAALELGLTENLIDQQSTPDLGVHAALRLRPGE